MLESKKEALLSELVAQLCAERNFAFPQVQGFDELWQHFRALVNRLFIIGGVVGV